MGPLPHNHVETTTEQIRTRLNHLQNGTIIPLWTDMHALVSRSPAEIQAKAAQSTKPTELAAQEMLDGSNISGATRLILRHTPPALITNETVPLIQKLHPQKGVHGTTPT
eukprot:5411928-Ditylum_brightwellii.AAC.1